MTAYQFYLSDDALPTFTDGPLRNEDIIGDSALRHFLQNQGIDWGEPPVKALLEKAVGNPQWRVSAARNPEFFLKNFESSLDRPDVLIFDWDYPGLAKSSEDYLAEFLEKTYCLVRIYTGVEKIQEVKDVLVKERFLPYQSRVTVSQKSQVDADALLKEVQEKQESNFSYMFGAKLRRTALESLEGILISLGKNSIDEVMALLNTVAATETDFKGILVEKIRNHLREDETLVKFLEDRKINGDNAQALIDLIAEKLRNDLNSADIQLVQSNLGGVEANDPKVAGAAASLWSYRLYHRPSDKRVRRGDIIKRKSDGKYFAVVTADCDLNKLWQKNYGHVNLVPIFQFKKDCPNLTARFRLAKIKGDAVFTINSLTKTPNKLADGTLLLPFLPVGKELLNFLVFPKEITSVCIADPANADGDVDKIRNSSLSYEYLNEFERTCTISEPFLTPFIDTLLETLSGLGVPDYPGPVQDTINDRSRAALA